MANCPIHQVPYKLIPAGVSKKTGRPYPAFEVCPVEGCNEKPQAPLSPQEPLDQAIIQASESEVLSRDKERTRLIQRQHSQEMAIRYLELKWKYEPPTKGKLLLTDKLKLMIDWFMKDLEGLNADNN